MHLKSTCAVCPVVEEVDAAQYRKQMVRQRNVGETGGENG